MKKGRILALAVTVLLSFVMIFAAACGPDNPNPSGTPGPSGSSLSGAGELIVFDMIEKNNVVITSLELTSITNIFVGSSKISESGYTYSNGTLTINGSALSEKISTAGPKPLTLNNNSVVKSILAANKIITTVQELSSINITNADDENYIGGLKGTYVLGNDINCLGDTGLFFEPIGSVNAEGYPIKAFTGVFEGAGHKIYNLKIDAYRCEDERNVPNGIDGGSGMGLFGLVSGSGEIRNFSLVESEINGRLLMGAVVGSIENGAKAYNIYVGDDVYVNAEYVKWDMNTLVGGFVGIAGKGAVIRECISRAQLTMDGNPVNPLLRGFAGKTWGNITNCYADSTNFTNITVKSDPPVATDDTYVGFHNGKENAYVSTENTYEGFTYLSWDYDTSEIMGTITNSGMATTDDLKSKDLYSRGTTKYDPTRWTIVDGQIPTLIVLYQVN